MIGDGVLKRVLENDEESAQRKQLLVTDGQEVRNTATAPSRATIAEALVKDSVCRSGVPMNLHSNQARNVELTLFQDLSKLLGIKKTRMPSLHPP